MMRITTFLLLFLWCHAFAQPYKYLVLKGGGIRGIAYTGAIKALEEHNLTKPIERVAGTSVGAITAALFSVGYTASQMEDIMFGLDISSFNDGDWFFIGGQHRMRRKFGWYKGEQLEKWVGTQLKNKTGHEDLTFRQLHELAIRNSVYKDLYVTATNLTSQRLEIFSRETHPDMPIKLAVRASASIPLYYCAIFIDSNGNAIKKPEKFRHYNVYVDGGLLANYPLDIFKNAPEGISATLGLKLSRPEQIIYQENNQGLAPFDIHTMPDYIAALYNLGIEQLNKSVPFDEEKKNTIYISTGNLAPRVRHIPRAQKQLLFDNGKDAAEKFIKQDQSTSPVQRR